MNAIINVCLERMCVVHMIERRSSIEGVCDGNFAGFCVRVCVDLSLYVGLYETIDVS